MIYQFNILVIKVVCLRHCLSACKLKTVTVHSEIFILVLFLSLFELQNFHIHINLMGFSVERFIWLVFPTVHRIRFPTGIHLMGFLLPDLHEEIFYLNTYLTGFSIEGYSPWSDWWDTYLTGFSIEGYSPWSD